MTPDRQPRRLRHAMMGNGMKQGMCISIGACAGLGPVEIDFT
jgi:hypothetical protein